jgi:hypothetical protein
MVLPKQEQTQLCCGLLLPPSVSLSTNAKVKLFPLVRNVLPLLLAARHSRPHAPSHSSKPARRQKAQPLNKPHPPSRQHPARLPQMQIAVANIWLAVVIAVLQLSPVSAAHGLRHDTHGRRSLSNKKLVRVRANVGERDGPLDVIFGECLISPKSPAWWSLSNIRTWPQP